MCSNLSLNRLKLRHEAYPFDWCKIKLPKLIKAFKEDFKEYDKLSIKKFSEAHEDTFLIENLYGNFAHEVSKEMNLIILENLYSEE